MENEALQARDRIDALLSARCKTENGIPGEKIDSLLTDECEDAAKTIEALAQVLHTRGSMCHRVSAASPVDNTLPSIEAVLNDLQNGNVNFSVEDTSGRRYVDCKPLTVDTEVHDTSGHGHQVIVNLSTALQFADRSIPPGRVIELATVLGRIAWQVGKRTEPTALVLPSLSRINVVPDPEQREVPQEVIIRVGVARWTVSHYGLGAEICVLGQLAVSKATTTAESEEDSRCGRLQEGIILRCSAHTKCALNPAGSRGTVTEDGDVFYEDGTTGLAVLPLQHPWLRVWCDSFKVGCTFSDGDAKNVVQSRCIETKPSNINSVRPITTSLLGWGDNPRCCLGMDFSSVVLVPTRIPMNTLPFERVRAVSCSARHTLVLTWRRRLFSCGDNEDGACGVEGCSRVSTLAAVAWPNEEPVETKCMAAGSDIFGAHSAAVSTAGALYTWGFGVATGHRTTAPVPRPRSVQYSEGLVELPAISTVAAGGSFCIALDERGTAYSWGIWASGRLGLGPIPSLQQSRTSYEDRRRLALYQLYPKQLTHVGSQPSARMVRQNDPDHQPRGSQPAPKWKKIACGEAHVLAMTTDGRLYAWGQNTYGQLGMGPPAHGSFLDEVSPIPVTALSSSCSGGLHECADRIVVTAVACGPTHSVAIDMEGNAWTWGGGPDGSSMLGHGDYPPASRNLIGTTELMAKRMLDEKRRGNNLNVVGNDHPVGAMHWAWPRRLESGCRVKTAACGERHTVLHTADDNILVFGDGFATIGWSRKTAATLHAATSTMTSEESTTELGEVLAEVAATTSNHTTIHTPRMPNTRWLQEIHGMRIQHVACGGQRTLVCLSGLSASVTLGRKLFEKASSATAYLAEQMDDDNTTDTLAVTSTLGEQFGVDCLLIPGGGSHLCAHLAVLSRRSKLFEELILLELREDGADDNMLQLLVPDLSPAIARALLEFIYCDDLFETTTGTNLRPSLLNELGPVAERYGLPRLAKICSFLSGDSLVSEEETPAKAEDAAVPSSTLQSDFESLIGDASFADVRVVAEGHTIYVHRLVLGTRSDYFRAMFASGMREVGGAIAPVEVHVPDSHIGMLRLLRYLYTDLLSDGETTLLLEDLVAADRYGLLQMRLACESSLATAVSSINEALAAMQVAQSIGASSLKTEMIQYITRHVKDPLVAASLPKFSQFEPDIHGIVCDALIASHKYAMDLPIPEPQPTTREDKLSINVLNSTQAAAMLAVSAVSLVLQRIFRLRQYAVMVINALFVVALASIHYYGMGKANPAKNFST